MRMESLQYFLEIVHTKSFTVAARRLYMSQQGLSKAIQTLEGEVGVSLFERSGKKVRLTDAGRDLVPLARQCTNSYQSIKDLMAYHAHKENVGDAQAPEIMVMPFVANAIFTLLRTEMDARGLNEIVPIEKDLPEILENISCHSAASLAMIAVPLSMIPCLLLGPEMTFEPLLESEIILTGSSALISPRKRSFSVAEIAQLPIARYNEPIINKIVGTLFAHCHLQNVIFHSSNHAILKEHIHAGKAAGFTDSFSAYMLPATENLLYTPIKDTLSFVVGFYYDKRNTLNWQDLRYIEQFKKLIEETCAPYLAKHPTPHLKHNSYPLAISET